MSTHDADLGPRWGDAITSADMAGLVSTQSPGGRQLTSFVHRLGNSIGVYELPRSLDVEVCRAEPGGFDMYKIPAGSQIIGSEDGYAIVTPCFSLPLVVDDGVLSIPDGPRGAGL